MMLYEMLSKFPQPVLPLPCNACVVKVKKSHGESINCTLCYCHHI